LNPAAAKAKLDAELASRRKFYNMPATRQLVGQAKIDMFGFEHGIILLNGMNYFPRPVGGGTFSTFTPYLMRLNGDFIADPRRRPGFYLLKYQTLDNHLAAQDDPLTFLGLIHHYEPVLIEQNYVVMREHPAPPLAAPQPAGATTFTFNEEVKVPEVAADRMLLASFEIQPSLWGRIRAALYKPPLVFMNQLGQNLLNGESRRLVGTMTQVPLPISPVIETNDDVLGLYTRQPGKTLYHFRLATDHPAAFDGRLKVNFYTVPRPPVPDAVDIDELIVSARYPLTNVRPDQVTAADAPLRQLGGVTVQMLMPPGEMVWKLQGNEREFLFDYGYDPTAYAQAAGNGTLYTVELRSPGKPSRELFRRVLDPAHHVDEQSTQSARVVLPALIPPGSQLVLRTDPGEFGDNAWDWAFVTKIQLKRGEYSKRQFPGFNRAPSAASLEQANPQQTDAGPVLVLHAPSFADFRLNGDETTLRFDYGFMPGAYTGEGATDGAIYTVDLVRPNHPRETLFRRHLEPRERPGDQGRQHASLDLPKLGPADHLVLTINPGPTNNNSWDWTYVTNLELK
jgi:hypothetical protein